MIWSLAIPCNETDGVMTLNKLLVKYVLKSLDNYSVSYTDQENSEQCHYYYTDSAKFWEGYHGYTEAALRSVAFMSVTFVTPYLQECHLLIQEMPIHRTKNNYVGKRIKL